MDGSCSLLLLAVPGNSTLSYFVNFGTLVAALILAIVSALALVRQLLFALWSRE